MSVKQLDIILSLLCMIDKIQAIPDTDCPGWLFKSTDKKREKVCARPTALIEHGKKMGEQHDAQNSQGENQKNFFDCAAALYRSVELTGKNSGNNGKYSQNPG